MNEIEQFSAIDHEKFELTGNHYYHVLIYYRELCEFYGNTESRFETMRWRGESRKEGISLSALSWKKFDSIVRNEIETIKAWLSANKWVLNGSNIGDEQRKRKKKHKQLKESEK